MKKKLLAVAVAIMMTLCTGCGETSAKKETYDNNQNNTPNDTPNNAPSSAKQEPAAPAYSEPAYDYNEPDDDYYDDYYDDDYYDFGDMTYVDFVMLCRDEIIQGAKSVTYQQLARSADGMEGEFVKLKGQITQIYDSTDGTYDYYEGMMSITYVKDDYFPYYTDSVLIAIPTGFVNQRPLVDDVITICGISTGLMSYETVLGDIRTEPTILAAQVKFS